MTKIDREEIKQKYNGLCAYSGTVLEPDWQIDHIQPLRREWDGSLKSAYESMHDKTVGYVTIEINQEYEEK